MARRGRGGSRGGRGSRARGDARSIRTPNGDARSSSTPKLSLVEEARWMSSHGSHAFEPGKQLRNLKIEFVSAGCLEGTIKDKKEPSSPASLSTNAHAMAHLTVRSPSPALSFSSSSEDEVVFKGRNTTPFSLASTTSTLPIRGPPTQAPAPAPAPASASSSVSRNPVTIPKPEEDSDADSVIQDVFERRLGGKSVWETNTPNWVHRSKPGIGWLPVADRPPMEDFLQGYANSRDAAMDDYAQNVEFFGNEEELLASIPAGFACREMDLEAGDHNDWASDISEVQRQEESGWNADTLRDLDGLSTSSDVIDVVECIISKRVRKNGTQYLVVYQGSVADDARWLPVSFLKTSNDLELIRIYEAESLSNDRRLGSSTDDENDTSEGDSEESDEIHHDDERLARILQKQEELGLSTNEVLLYGADAIFDGPLDPTTMTFESNKKRQNRARGGRRPQPSFPSASIMADILDMDPYHGFDVMDTERPSLRPRKKGRRGQMPPELEDFDLNEQLQAAWEVDRTTKRLKKAEREELRKQGLLGRKGKAPDLSHKYKDGFDMKEIKEDIREFMESDVQSLSLPPMDAKWRAVIHQKVKKLGLNSKSRGGGQTRFTVLSKTLRTKDYDDEIFDALFDGKKSLRGLQRGTFRQGLKTRAIVSYKDGDTVGASAPELGPENKGHALMAKMGWSKGMALGALDNKGILTPIPHVVKTSKAGLQ